MPPRALALLAVVFVIAAGVRLHGALTFGFDMDGPGSFRVINFDEGGSCRAVQGGYGYPEFLGYQAVALATLVGEGPGQADTGSQGGKRYCQSRPLIVIQRVYSAITGALTVVLTGLMALLMWPTQPRIAWTACVVLGLSNLHVAQSHWGTADAPQVFFTTLLCATLTYAVTSGRTWPWLVSPLLLIVALWTKLYLFAIFAFACVLAQPSQLRTRLRRHLPWLLAAAALAALVVWHDAGPKTLQRYAVYVWGDDTNRFGTGFGHIDLPRRWLRNGINLPLVLFVGLGVPASVCAWIGLRRALTRPEDRAAWLTHTPAAVYALYMLVLGPVTYYRHYLALFPTVALLSAYGLWQCGWARRPVLVAAFCLYPLLLTIDSEYNYRHDPRRQLSAFYETHGDPRTLASFYASPPEGARNTRPFSMDAYLQHGAPYLRQAQYLILSENWYDTAFANEINGPLVSNPEWMIRTHASHVRAYRAILAGNDPLLSLERSLSLTHFMPEFIAHRYFYGTFQRFIGDLKIYRVR